MINNKNEITTLDSKLSTLSNKYKLVATKEIANKFKSLGFNVDEYTETKVRKASKLGYQKHMVRLSNPTLLSSVHKDTKLQLLVTNSHDGLSSFSIKLGIYRLVCSNGLVVGKTFESVILRHTGSIIEQVDEAVERMVAQVSTLDNVITKMKITQLSVEQQNEFIAKAIQLRYPSKQLNDVVIPVLRPEDGENNVFSLFNRIQEALVRGGNQVRNNKNKFTTARALSSISKLTSLNESLFDLADQFSNAA